MQVLQFDYFRGIEAEQYNFYRIPKILFTDEYFKPLSCEAKVLYGLMLDRMGLSVKNKWFDEEEKPYIYFTVEEIMELMGCKSQKAVKLMKELDTKEGIGLIERKRVGLGKPNIIYVKNFMVYKVIHLEENQNFENQKSEISQNEKPEFPESKNQNFENQKSEILKNEDDVEEKISFSRENVQENSIIEKPEFLESKNQNGENQNSKIMKTENLEFRKSKSNNTDKSNTEYSDTNLINQSDEMEERIRTKDYICKNIEYGVLCSDYGQEEVDELVDLLVDTLASKRQTININAEPLPVELVKSRLMQINYLHIRYVFESLKKNTSKIHNIRQYLLTVLYNAPMTIKHYYQAEVNHDFFNACERGGNYGEMDS